MLIVLRLVCAFLCLGAGLAHAELAPLTAPVPPEPARPVLPAPDLAPVSPAPAREPAPAPIAIEPAPASAVHPESTDTAARIRSESGTRQTVFPDEQEKLWDLRTSTLFLERTHFALEPLRFSRQYSDAYGGDNTPLLFDATPALHLPVFNRLSELLAYDAPGRYFNAVPYVSLSFVPTVRMSQPSLDVLTPSYRVGANLQWFVQHSRLRGKPDDVLVHGVRLSFTHYSNGQGGCSFAKGQPDAKGRRDDSVCRAAYDAAQEAPSGGWFRRKVDEKSGSFSTNYFTLAYHARRVWLARSRRDADGLRAEDQSLTGGVIVNGVIGALNGEGQKHVYPLMSTRAETRYERVFNSYGYPLRVSGEVFVEGSFLDRRSSAAARAYTPWRAGAEFSATFPKINDLGVFAAVSGGQDPYNIQFVQRATWIQWGLVIDLFPRPRYGSGHIAPG